MLADRAADRSAVRRMAGLRWPDRRMDARVRAAASEQGNTGTCAGDESQLAPEREWQPVIRDLCSPRACSRLVLLGVEFGG